MKKMYIFAVALFATTTTIAQDSNDSLTFESITLTSESYYNGADGAGQIPFNSAILSNSYDTQWGSWTGFSISNMTDVTTSGYGNQYSSFTGGGSNSANFAVFYSLGTIEFNQPFLIKQLDITNTTFAALDMQSGSPYSKQFGSVNGADGLPDGTNGADYFVLHILPMDENNTLIGDTIHFYLADYRFADNNDDYILNTWQTLDLSAENIVANKLKFDLESTDNGEFGMNTPAYFALDNLVINSTVGLNESTLSFGLYPNPTNGIITLQTKETGLISVTNAAGQVITSLPSNGNSIIDLSSAPAGIYFVNLSTSNGNNTQKIIKY